MKKREGKFSAGFTLIELIVVMAVFLFIVGAAVAIFISVFQQQRRTLAEQQLLNQISYVEEYMSKALRMAKAATTDSDTICFNSGQNQNSSTYLGYIYLLTHYDSGLHIYRGIRFINQSSTDPSGGALCQEFYLDVASQNDPTLVLWEVKNNGAPVALTSTNLQFDPANPIRFSVDGYDGSGQTGCANGQNQCGATSKDGIQPRITILLNIKMAGDSQGFNGSASRIFQTTISQRNLNVGS